MCWSKKFSLRRSVLTLPAPPARPRSYKPTSSYLCKNFYQKLGVPPEDILGQPLASVVDPLDRSALATTLQEVLGARDQVVTHGGRYAPGLSGSLVNLRVTSRGVTCPASMTLVIGSQGLVVVTRLYPQQTT